MLKQCIIIGAGPAGSAAALAAVEAGLRSVVLVERDAFGGTCTNRGCIPTKFLLARSGSFAVPGAGSVPAPAEWSRTIQHKNALVLGLSRSIEERCRAGGVEIVHGRARFRGPHEIEVLHSGGARTGLEGERFVIAAGSRPAQIPGSPSNGRSIITSDEALSLDPLPASLAVIGSGAVGAEFAFIFQRLGVAVTVIEAADRLFPAEDPDVDGVFRKVYERIGIKVSTGDAVTGIVTPADGSKVAVRLASGAVVEADKALVGVGRALESQHLDCEAAGVSTTGQGAVTVDDQLRTSQPHILAAGDVSGRMLLAHAASYMGEFAGRSAAGVSFPPVPYHAIPWVTFTSPEVAAVGMSVDGARKAGIDTVSDSAPFMGNVKARIDRRTDGFVKIVAERVTGRILGGTIVGEHAADLIHVLALAIKQGMTIGDLVGFVFAHPSTAETVADVVMKLRSKLYQ